MSIINQISSIPLFQGLPENQLLELADIVVDTVFHRDQAIFSEGDEGTGLYVLVTGRVKIFKLSADGKEQILHIFDNGEPFGEVAVFAGMHFPANAEAMEESQVFYFPRDALVDLIRKDPSIALNMLAVLSRRNSTRPALASLIARGKSSAGTTVPAFGLGIKPRGPSTLPRRPALDIISGVEIATSKSVKPS